MEVKTEDGTICKDNNVVLNTWKCCFDNLLNNKITENVVSSNTNYNILDNFLDSIITLDEVYYAITKAKSGKSSGIDQIPVDVLKNDLSVRVLCNIFNVCFNSGKIPKMWGKGIITPIPKCSTSDPRDPLSYRGITLASCVYKLYCSILNDRLTYWLDCNNIINDEQNGFRKERSTIDHIGTLISIIENRKLNKLPTFTAFIDFKKAYDTVNRKLLFNKLGNLGISSHFLNVLKSLYAQVECCVKLNGHMTDWFSVTSGLKQGCVLSPILFNIFINDLVDELKTLNVGIKIDEDLICVLLYADDVVLMAENESDLQVLLDVLSSWCSNNFLSINFEKSNIVHFRNMSTPRTTNTFKIGNNIVQIASHYQYLGLLLTEFLDYNEMAKAVSKSANRALSLLIVKTKANGGFQYSTFTKLFDTLVWPVISYGASIWGTRSFSCIDSVQHKAIRFFMNVGKYTPNDSLNGDMGWKPMIVKQWTSIFRHWSRCKDMSNDRLNYKVFYWSFRNAVNNKKNWCFKVMEKFRSVNCEQFCKLDRYFNKNSILYIENVLFNDYKEEWHKRVSSYSTGKKLRTYKLFKSHYGTEKYVLSNIQRRYKSAFAKFRFGVAPLKIETGRYENMAVNDRKCFICLDDVEDEKHVILTCPLYADLRRILYNECASFNVDFNNMSDDEKFLFLFSNNDVSVLVAKTCFSILSRRNSFLYE